MQKLLKIVLAFMIIIISATYDYTSIGANKTDLQNEKQNLADSIKESQKELENIQEQKSETLKDVENLMDKISDYQSQIDELNSKISSLETKIKAANTQIKEDEAKYEKGREELNQRLIAMYENGETSYLDVMFSANSLTDFISGYYMVSELATYDTDMLEQIEQEKQKIEAEKVELENNKQSLDATKKEKKAKADSLSVAKKEKEQKASELSQEEQETQKEIEEMLEDKKVIESELARIAKQEAEAAEKAAKEAASKKNNSSTPSIVYSGNPSSSGYIFPVAGLSKASIRNKTFPSYSGHTGVDVNIGVAGKSIVAVKDGTVVTSTALKNSSGGYRSYGEYVIIRHNDGTATLYAHMLAGSRTVSSGQTVKQGQVIGTVGSTGNSTGTHLHFEVRVLSGSSGTYSYKVVNPLPYLP